MVCKKLDKSRMATPVPELAKVITEVPERDKVKLGAPDPKTMPSAPLPPTARLLISSDNDAPMVPGRLKNKVDPEVGTAAPDQLAAVFQRLEALPTQVEVAASNGLPVTPAKTKPVAAKRLLGRRVRKDRMVNRVEGGRGGVFIAGTVRPERVPAILHLFYL